MSSLRPWARGRVLAVLLAVLGVLVLPLVGAAPAQAHPLGNFTVNHYNALSLSPERVELRTIIDSAEIPTQQDRPTIDADGDGEMSGAELSNHANLRCEQVREDVTVDVDGAAVRWTSDSAEMELVPGQAGLPTARMTCTSSAPVDLGQEVAVSMQDDYRSDRIGWHEITATGDGVRLVDPAVPSTSVSEELREYPEDLLSSPLDVRSVTLEVEPGSSGASSQNEGSVPGFTGSDPFSRMVTAGDRMLDSFIADRELTIGLGALAVVLAVLLGAGHAILPGHGKTVMAAYLAGRRGRPMDAIVVGATVTVTHTAGVLVLGLLLTLTSAFAGEQALRVLGIISGLLIAAIGASLVRDAVRARQTPQDELVAMEHGHAHAHAHGHAHDHGHAHEHSHPHGHGHSHNHGDSTGRRGLIGMGVAGGLVPSPSALVVLLGAIALGRTVFGVLLVLAYGAGMAATLTAVGLLLVRLRGRLDHLVDRQGRGTPAARVAAALPIVTAVLVLVVGLGLVARGLFFTL